MTALTVYYLLKPLIPRRFQIWMRRRMAARKRRMNRDSWPILEKAGEKPKGWKGWPEGKTFAFVLTHDVDTARGQERCLDLAKMEKELGFRSAFNFVPERYEVSSKLRDTLGQWGFEVGVHGLNHDGKLFRSKKIFSERAKKINHYLRDWNAMGFRAPAMHHNLKWIGDLNIEYDSSTFDTDPFEPQPEGIETIFPFFFESLKKNTGYVELPCTVPQDFTIFILLKEKTIDLWKRKIDWIAEKKGMALMNTHPDYMRKSNCEAGIEEYPMEKYKEFLFYMLKNYQKSYWHAIPSEVSKFMRY